MRIDLHTMASSHSRITHIVKSSQVKSVYLSGESEQLDVVSEQDVHSHQHRHVLEL